jgi:hypothetical protein
LESWFRDDFSGTIFISVLIFRLVFLTRGVVVSSIGTIPHLKKKFASGYQIDVKVQHDSIEPFKPWLKSQFTEVARAGPYIALSFAPPINVTNVASVL